MSVRSGEEVPDRRTVAAAALDLFARSNARTDHFPSLGSIPQDLGVAPQAFFQAYGWKRGLWETVDAVVLELVKAGLGGDISTRDPFEALSTLASRFESLAADQPTLVTYLRYSFAEGRPLATACIHLVAASIEEHLGESVPSFPLGQMVLATVLLAPSLDEGITDGGARVFPHLRKAADSTNDL